MKTPSSSKSDVDRQTAGPYLGKWGGGGAVAYHGAVGHTARGSVRERDVPPPAQSAEAKTILPLCEMHGRLKRSTLQH